MGAFWQDLRYALRTLRRTPGFTSITILLLMLGIGVNTCVFSLVYAVLLHPLPYSEPEKLVRLVRGPDQHYITVPEFAFTKTYSTSFVSVAAYRGGGDQTLKIRDSFEWISVMMASPGLLRTLGVPPALGREFQAGLKDAREIILSDALWRRTFEGSPDVVGKTMILNDTAYTVVGVLPRDFWSPQTFDALVPLQPDSGSNSVLVARLKSAIGLKQAEAELATFIDGYRQVNINGVPQTYRGLMPIGYQESLAGDMRTKLLLLFGAVAMTLLIACSNVAGLMSARLAARRREIAIRVAVGSSASRLFRQFVLENTLLSVGGGLAGLLAATGILAVLVGHIQIPASVSAPVSLNLPALVFTFVVTLAISLVLSSASFLSSVRVNIYESLQSGSRATGGKTQQLTRSLLVAGQLAVSVTLLVSAALLIQTLYLLQQENLGFSPRGVITFRTPVSPERRGRPAELRQIDARTLERLQTLPGVQRAAAVNMLPLTGQNNFPTQRDGHPEDSIGGMEIRVVTPQYFETMGIPIVRGRRIADTDTSTARPVIIVSERVARQWWDGTNPLGDHVVIGRFRDRTLGNDSPREVVGVVADTKSVFLKDPPRFTVYIPAAQWEAGGMSWVVKGNITADQVRLVIREIDPTQRVERFRSMDEIVAATTADSRLNAWLYGAFAGLALTLTVVGVYGLLSFSVARRTREVGTRMALGASRIHILRMILRQGTTLIAIGLAAGLVTARALTPWLESLLFGIHATDRFTYVAVAVLLFFVGILASYIPARRATRVDPVVALRAD